MRVVYFGTSEFAVPILERLARCPFAEVAAVVTQPDRPQGRGRQLAMSPVKQAALALGLDVLQPPRVRAAAFREALAALQPDAIALASFGQIIPQSVLDLPPLGPINVHASLLPAYRGAAPIHHAILNGEPRTGVTTMWMDATLDTGDMLLARELEIGAAETTGELTMRLAEAGAELLVETLERILQGDCPRTPQDHTAASWAPAILPEDARIRWDEPTRRICDRIRAMAPRPGAAASIRGRRVKLWAAHVDATAAPAPAGAVLGVARDGVTVAAPGGAVILTEVQPENSRRMLAAEWARGARIAPGEAFDPGPAATE